MLPTLRRCFLSLSLLFAVTLLAPGANAAPIVLGDDDFQEIALGFAFPFFGTDYNSVFVGSNGFLTFGSGDTDFSESVADFLNDQPRISGFWDDLHPGSGGSIDGTGDANSFVVTFSGVPDFLASGSNSFAMTIFADGSIEFVYESRNDDQALVGLSPGGGVADPGGSDLSALGNPIPFGGPIYQLFSNDFDLQFLRFEPTDRGVIPEPTTALLLGLGLVGLAGRRRNAA